MDVEEMDDVSDSELASFQSGIKEIYQAGIMGKEIHEHADRYFGESLPCQRDGRCQYMERRDFEPSDYDVLVGHYLQAHNEDYVNDRYVAFDEFPGDAYFFEPTHNEATRAITNFLKNESELPFENWKDLDRRRETGDNILEYVNWLAKQGYYSHRDTRVRMQDSHGYHAYAPILTHAGLEFELLENEWEYADLYGGRVAVKSPDDEWTVLIPPGLYKAESIVALDGTPNITKWRLVLGGRWVEHMEVLESSREKRDYLKDVLGLKIIQTDAGAKPYQSGRHVNERSDGALLEGIRQREGAKPSVITSKKARDRYEEAGVDNLIDEAEHYGNLKGSNKFETTRLGAVIGSPHPPEDEAVERWGALEGEAVGRKENEAGLPTMGLGIDFGALGNSLFYDVVHNEVLQALMRFGRTQDEESGEKGADVYVHTARLPSWVKADQRIEVSVWSEGMKEVVNALRSSSEWPEEEMTNKEIAERTSIKQRQVGELMKELDEEGYVTHRRGGRGNAYHWSNVRLEELTKFGRVE